MLSYDRLTEVLDYCSDTGLFKWKKSLSSRAVKGSSAGTTNGQGYRQIRVDGVIYQAHRLAWLFAKKQEPTNWIDHISGVTVDNSIKNLRLCTASENHQNRRGPSKRTTTGFLGVSTYGSEKKFRAEIRIDNKGRHIGCFNSAEEAYDAYLKEKRKIHPFCTI